MKITKEEKERRHYNKKLIWGGLKRETRTIRKVNWVDLGIYGIGCFIGLWLNSIIDVKMFIKNGFLSLAVEVLIIAASIMITHTFFYKLKNIFKK